MEIKRGKREGSDGDKETENEAEKQTSVSEMDMEMNSDKRGSKALSALSMVV